MTIIETTHTTGAAQTIATDVLGYIPGVSQAGRLGTELAFESIAKADLDSLRKALRRGGHTVWTSRTK